MAGELKVGSRRRVSLRRARLVVKNYFGHPGSHTGKSLFHIGRLGVRKTQRREVGDSRDGDIFAAALYQAVLVEKYLYPQ